MISKWIAIAGAVLAGAGVMLGAFGAHGLEGRLAQMGYGANVAQRLGWFETGVRYQLYHALGLLVLASFAGRMATSWLQGAAWAFVLGVALFSGSLFVMTFAGDEWRKLGMVTPLGGLAFIVGWVLVAIGACRS